MQRHPCRQNVWGLTVPRTLAGSGGIGTTGLVPRAPQRADSLSDDVYQFPWNRVERPTFNSGTPPSGWFPPNRYSVTWGVVSLVTDTGPDGVTALTSATELRVCQNQGRWIGTLDDGTVVLAWVYTLTGELVLVESSGGAWTRVDLVALGAVTATGFVDVVSVATQGNRVAIVAPVRARSGGTALLVAFELERAGSTWTLVAAPAINTAVSDPLLPVIAYLPGGNPVVVAVTGAADVSLWDVQAGTTVTVNSGGNPCVVAGVAAGDAGVYVTWSQTVGSKGTSEAGSVYGRVYAYTDSTATAVGAASTSATALAGDDLGDVPAWDPAVDVYPDGTACLVWHQKVGKGPNDPTEIRVARLTAAATAAEAADNEVVSASSGRPRHFYPTPSVDGRFTTVVWEGRINARGAPADVLGCLGVTSRSGPPLDPAGLVEIVRSSGELEELIYPTSVFASLSRLHLAWINVEYKKNGDVLSVAIEHLSARLL